MESPSTASPAGRAPAAGAGGTFSAPPTLTAVIVVAGVGDDRAGRAARRAAGGLVAHAGFDWAEETVETFRVEDDVQRVTRVRVHRDGAPPVDVYELWWADFSRFPAALRSFAVALLGLFLQITSVGRAGLRAGGGEPGRAALRASPGSASDGASGALGLIE